jgi:hypothetical protein
MLNFSGTFSGRATSQTVISLEDVPNHEMHLATINGLQKSTDEKWKDSRITYWDVTDLIAGNGPQRGYFVNLHSNGDRDIGTFEGKVVTAGGQVTIEGTWKYTDGTGMFKGIVGGGTYKGRMTSPTEVENTWEGTYEIAARARVA